MALWARPTGTIKNAVAQGIPRRDPGRSVVVCVTLVDGSNGEVIRERLVETKSQRDRYDKQLERRIKAAIMLEKKVQVDALQ